jgi:G3E family GTPase
MTVAASAPQRPPIAPIALIVLGGYLGAGKTTLLNRLLADAQGRRVTVLVNDFGAINIDASLIREQSDDVISLENGCVCCSIGGRLVQALVEISARADPPDVLIIEASGVSDPVRIAQVGMLDRAFRLHAIVVAVDAQGIGETLGDPYVGDIVRRQIEGATALVLTKTDLIDESAKGAVTSKLLELAGTRIVIEAMHGAIPPALVFDATPAGTRQPNAPALRSATPAHLPAGLRSFTFRSEARLNRARLKEALRVLGPRLLRAKGFVLLDDAGAPQELHVVGPRIRLGAFSGAVSAESTIVLIGLFDPEDERLAIGALHSAAL